MGSKAKPEVIGILGDGQLARMLGVAGKALGKEILIFSKRKTSSASLAGLQVESDRSQFVEKTDLIIFESEFSETSGIPPDKCFPSLDAIQVLSQKLEQKKIFERLKIPTSEFVEMDAQNLESSLEMAVKQLGDDFVLKTSFGGYDGRGVLLGPKSASERLDFCQKAIESGSRIYAEKKVPFSMELALVSVVSDSERIHFPLVVSKQQRGICDEVSGPAEKLGLSPQLTVEATRISERVSAEISIEGAYAIEFFLSVEGELLVNELAPRVHNSGHYSLLQPEASQFSNHLRAALREPLVPFRSEKLFGMKNLIGQSFLEGPFTEMPWPDWCKWENYQKLPVEVGRKMGHFYFEADKLEDLNERFLKLDSKIKEFWENQL
jgi:5-(carboxyamino)imidazole ribonucleotide synthase